MVINNFIYPPYVYIFLWDLKIQKVNEEFDSEMPQSHTADQPVAL